MYHKKVYPLFSRRQIIDMDDFSMEGLSLVSRRPPPPVIMYRDFDCDEEERRQTDHLYLPDITKMEVRMVRPVTWFFDDFEDYTAEPYVAEIPEVDYLGYNNMQRRRRIFDTFYLYGLQLVPGDLEHMERKNWTLVKLIDTLIRWESNGKKTVHNIWDQQKQDRRNGFMFLPFLYTYGMKAKYGRHHIAHPLKDPVPEYPGPPPPVYEVVEVRCEVPIEVAEVRVEDEEEQDVILPSEPPSYDATMARDASEEVTAAIRAKDTACESDNGFEAHDSQGSASEQDTESDSGSDLDEVSPTTTPESAADADKDIEAYGVDDETVPGPEESPIRHQTTCGVPVVGLTDAPTIFMVNSEIVPSQEAEAVSHPPTRNGSDIEREENSAQLPAAHPSKRPSLRKRLIRQVRGFAHIVGQICALT
ncbi:hypothetical protein GGS20DRAFT_569281 [Poronia punctata]|nr:hypothetical protein GGS20DRAFT_569281 [Poronia punctata]